MRTSRGFRITLVIILGISALAFFELERRAAIAPQTHDERPPLATIPPPSTIISQVLPTSPAGETRNPVKLTSPCAAQITLRIGTVDPEFELERAALETALGEAANEWNSATGREWFTISSTDGIVVNLLFDGRQAEIDTRKVAEATLEAELAIIGKEMEEEHQGIERLITSFNQEETHYKDSVSAHNAAVSRAREAGSVSQEILASLRDEEGHLRELRGELDGQFKRIKTLIDQFMERKPEREKIFHEKVATFRRHYPPLLIREAEHRRGAFVNEVNVYAFTDSRDLHYNLLHELGHTLGLSHANDADAVMSPVREAHSEVYHLTKSDIDAALKLCQELE